MSFIGQISRPASLSPRVIALGGAAAVRSDRRRALRELRAADWRRRYASLSWQIRQAEAHDRTWMARAMDHAAVMADFCAALAKRDLAAARGLLALRRAMRAANEMEAE